MQPRREIINRHQFEHSDEGGSFIAFKRELQQLADGPIDKTYSLKNKEGEAVDMDLREIYEFLREELRGGKTTTIIYETLKTYGLAILPVES